MSFQYNGPPIPAAHTGLGGAQHYASVGSGFDAGCVGTPLLHRYIKPPLLVLSPCVEQIATRLLIFRGAPGPRAGPPDVER
ncbi:unnamed protein product [Gadus morhua 'NCC']